MQLLHLHSRASRGAAVPLSVLQDACPAPSPPSLETAPQQPAQSQGDAQREFGGVPDRAGFDAFTTLVQHPRAARKALCPNARELLSSWPFSAGISPYFCLSFPICENTTVI